ESIFNCQQILQLYIATGETPYYLKELGKHGQDKHLKQRVLNMPIRLAISSEKNSKEPDAQIDLVFNQEDR
ncbi:hypothetical protein DICVIV_14061, partial [Dictyocaulus viviparus]